MKIEAAIILGIAFIIGFNQNHNQENVIEKVNSTTKIEKNIEGLTDNIYSELIQKEQLSLFPIDVVDSKSKDIYKKYGIEFSGNCYECDLTEFSVTEKTIKLTNVCDVKLNQVFKIVKITNAKSKIEIKTTQNDFVFTEIEKAPVYELKITGKLNKTKNLRISKYYTLKNLLKKFEQHDCGDFEG